MADAYGVQVSGQAEEKLPKFKLEELVKSPNIAEMIKRRNGGKQVLARIGSDVVNGYRTDLQSRTEWSQRNADGMKLALQVVEQKSFPWDGCANIKFPLVTIAALQFLSRVAILTKGRQLVKYDAVGVKDQKEIARARRISAHMSYQLVEEDIDWMDDDEKAKLAASIVGCAFKKSYFDPVEGINISEHVTAENFVVNYWTKSLKRCPRATHFIPMTENDLQERVIAGTFLPLDKTSSELVTEGGVLEAAKQQAQGSRPAQDDNMSMYGMLEQHTWLDLDGDGYQEPYIITAELKTGFVTRIVARFFDQGDVYRKNDDGVRRYKRMAQQAKDQKNDAAAMAYEAQAKKLSEDSNNAIIRIVAQNHFTKYTFIPSPDGGYYDLGLGALLGPCNDSVNTIINQLVDCGTMATTAGGFLGRGAKLKGGKNSFEPFEWKPVDGSGDDLRKSVFPLPVREPSEVLFKLLGLLITYGEKISGSTDIMTGVSPGQNTPAETSRNTIEQGMKIFSGIYIRMYRAFTSELRILYNLNRYYLESSQHFDSLTLGTDMLILRDDYLKNGRVCPAADPSVASEEQRRQKAGALLQVAHGNPGYNMYLVNRRFLEANDYEDIEEILPDPNGENAIKPPPNPKFIIEQGKLELEQQRLQAETQFQMIDYQQRQAINEAKIAELNAKAQKELAEAKGVDSGHAIALINAQVGAAEAENKVIAEALRVMQKSVDQMHQHHKAAREHDLRQQEVDNAAKQQLAKGNGSGANQ